MPLSTTKEIWTCLTITSSQRKLSDFGYQMNHNRFLPFIMLNLPLTSFTHIHTSKGVAHEIMLAIAILCDPDRFLRWPYT